MTAERALELSKYLLFGENLSGLSGMNEHMRLKFMDVILSKFGLHEEGHLFESYREASTFTGDYFESFYEHFLDGGKWEWERFTAPSSLSEVQSYVGCNYNLEPLSGVCQYFKEFSPHELTAQSVKQLMDSLSEADWVEDVAITSNTSSYAITLATKYMASLVCNAKEPDDKIYQETPFLKGDSVKDWCNAVMDALNLFPESLPEDCYYAFFPSWLLFLCSAVPGDGMFFYFSNKNDIDEYVVWRMKNKDRKDELFLAMDRAYFVLSEPLLFGENLFLSKDMFSCVTGWTDSGFIENLSPFFRPAQEIFDALFPLFKAEKDKLPQIVEE